MKQHARQRWLLGLGWLVALALSACGGSTEDESANVSVPCGSATCSASEYCCDASCGMCVEEGVACTETCGE